MSENEKKGSSNKILFIGIALLGALNIFQFQSGSSVKETADLKIDSLFNVSVDIGRNLDVALSDIEKYKGINADLDVELEKRQAEIVANKEELQKLIKSGKANKSLIAKLRKIEKDLNSQNEKLLEDIDKYITENKSLKTENKELYSTVSSLETQKSALSQQVDVASVVRTEYLNIKTLKPRSGGKFKETGLARRTSKFEVCLSMLENKVTEKGMKTVYVSIIAPDEKTIGNKGKGSGVFTSGDEEVFYTMKREIEFKGDKIEGVCLSYDEGSNNQFEEGNYTVKIFVDQVLTKVSTISLK